VRRLANEYDPRVADEIEQRRGPRFTRRKPEGGMANSVDRVLVVH
jgi:hypothetical protein